MPTPICPNCFNLAEWDVDHPDRGYCPRPGCDLVFTPRVPELVPAVPYRRDIDG